MDKINFKQVLNENLDTIIKLLAIPSVYDETSVSNDKPYGQYVYEAFDFMKTLAQNDGFEVTNYDNQAFSISHGKGDKRIDIASHIDVVQAEASDFNIRVEDNKLYGRGTIDMKVPMFLTYLSLKLLKEKYPNINKEIRIVLGCDEERTMNDMKHYVNIAGYPDFAFTPDGTFPMGIGEKGAIMWTLSGDYVGVVESLNAGSQCNIVSPVATCIINDNDIDAVNKYINTNNINGKVELVDNKLSITVFGKGAHASIPFEGHSATTDLLKLISDIYGDELCKNLYETYADYYGRGFNSFTSEEFYECLTVNLGILKIENNKVFGQVDCRYPFTCDCHSLTDKLTKVSKVNVSLDYNDDPTMCDENDPYVKTMLDTYRQITGDNTRPVVSGGVSYSKVFKHCVSFGVGHPSKISLAHQKGEYVDLDDCAKWFRIYYESIENLMILEV